MYLQFVILLKNWLLFGSFFLSSCCFEFAWNIHYHDMGTERAKVHVKVCGLFGNAQTVEEVA